MMDRLDMTTLLISIDGWLSRLKPRWMDLIGDYAGDEFFVVDGDSLCQLVLDDELLVIGNDKKPGFQVLHALHNLEQALLALKKRECNFEIIFFDCNKHATIWAGNTDFTNSSRFLARQIMKSHIAQLPDVSSAGFHNLKDARWQEYVKSKQPMFVFCHSGPKIDDKGGNNSMYLSRIILQRTFIRDVLLSRIAVSLLNEARYVDSKILSFVYERQRLDDTKSGMPEAWSVSNSASVGFCDDLFSRLAPPETFPLVVNRDNWITQSVACYLAEYGDLVSSSVAFVFVASQLVLPFLSIEQRAQHPRSISKDLLLYLTSSFYPKLFGYLGSSLDNSTFMPDVDGNLFLVLLNAVIESRGGTMTGLIGDSYMGTICAAWDDAKLVVPDLSILSTKFQSSVTAISPPVESTFELLPFSHPVLDKYLQSVAVHTSSANSKGPDTRTRLDKLCDEPFIDEKHWHNNKSVLPKHLGGKDENTVTNLSSWERMKQLRKDQRFMTNLQRNAQTMTGAKGQPIQRIVISEVGTKSASKREKNTSLGEPAHSTSKPGKTTKSKTPQLSSAEKLKAKIKVEKQTKKASEDEIWWKSQLKEIGGLNPGERLEKVESILRGKRTDNGWLSVEVSLYRIHLALSNWVLDEEGEKELVCERNTVQILRYIHKLRDHGDLFPVAAQILAQVLSILGFDNFTPPKANTLEDRELGFKFIKLIKSKSGKPMYPYLHIKASPAEFQLMAYGTYMDRSMDSAPDSRVGFEPDGWQREVLDRIDRKESTLVVAPTSAGKTFSSFYAMEKVLRESDDGIIVYISPTKALCQQIAADVYARFSKNLKGKTVWAIHTRDFRVHDPLKTQILVTVPDILSMMLLSPSIANVWTPRLKLIIMDEIHSIGQLEGGQVWEHILLLSTCPILGLSATIGQPQDFSDWIGSVQKEHGRAYSMVEHKHRYSHLRKYVWHKPSPETPQGEIFRGLQSQAPGDEHIRVLHPMSALLLGGRSIPPDLALEAQDCLSLYRMMKECVPGNTIMHLEPEIYFDGRKSDFLKQADVIQYEEALKEVVMDWMKGVNMDQPESPYQKLLDSLRRDMHHSEAIDALEDADAPDIAISQLVHLLHKLDAQGDLPCLAFDLDRSGCEKYGKSLLEALTTGEQKWRHSDPRWTEKLKQWEAWKANSKVRERDAQRASRQKKDDEREVHSTTWQSQFNPDEPTPEFSFANMKCGYSREELDQDIYDLKRQGTPNYLILALERGIAIHHAGMPKGYRSLVESLFRLGYCRVVISTGTLALGINAPAKSVIFLDDSPYLTALMYRQCSGRAGRRGFDLLGKVIFYNFPMDRIHRLMLSRIPPLTGNWPLTTTLCLRLFNLLTGSNHAPSAVSAIDSFMRLPRLSVSSDQSREEVLHHMRFSIDFLQRSRLLSNTGHTTALFGFVGHLYYEEPGNLVFTSLIRAGVLHRICSKFKTNQSETERDIVLLVATLFARRPLPYFAASRQALEARRKVFPSVIKLPQLPKYIVEVFEKYNQDTLEVFTAYATTYAAHHLKGSPDNILPLSNIEVGTPAGISGMRLESILRKTSVRDRVACSSFVSNSGHGDSFSSVSDLCRSARSGLHLNGHSIPYFDYSSPVNAYAYDYWQHESVRPLVEANGLRRGDVWFALQSFSLTLAALTASLRVLLVERGATELNGENEEGEAEGEDLDHSEGKFYNEEDEVNGQPALLDRPIGVPEEDWLVYEAFQSVHSTFYEKWKKMWA